MFSSWSAKPKRVGDNTNTQQQHHQTYPGNRGPTQSHGQGNTSNSNSYSHAPTIQGSIRPPSSFTRAQHLESYLNDDTLKRSTRRVSADDSTYDTVFQTVSGVTLILRVHLPPSQHPSAPVQPPSMTLAGVRARHSWLDSQMRVTGYSVVASQDAWNQAFLLLGPAVHQVVTHLQLNPPDIMEITDTGLRSIQPKSQSVPAVAAATPSAAASAFPRRPPQYAGATNHSASVSAMDAPPDYESLLEVPEMDMPPIPTEFEELEPLTREELEELLQGDELEFERFCHKLPVSSTIQSIASSVVDENAVMARANLDREEELNQKHTSVTALQKQVETNIKAFRALEEQQNVVLAPPDMRHVMHQLARAKKQAFDESEQMAEDWLEEQGAGGDVTAFLDGFTEKRRVHHLRAAKLELLQYNHMNNGGGNDNGNGNHR